MSKMLRPKVTAAGNHRFFMPSPDQSPILDIECDGRRILHKKSVDARLALYMDQTGKTNDGTGRHTFSERIKHYPQTIAFSYPDSIMG